MIRKIVAVAGLAAMLGCTKLPQEPIKPERAEAARELRTEIMELTPDSPLYLSPEQIDENGIYGTVKHKMVTTLIMPFADPDGTIFGTPFKLSPEATDKLYGRNQPEGTGPPPKTIDDLREESQYKLDNTPRDAVWLERIYANTNEQDTGTRFLAEHAVKVCEPYEGLCAYTLIHFKDGSTKLYITEGAIDPNEKPQSLDDLLDNGPRKESQVVSDSLIKILQGDGVEYNYKTREKTIDAALVHIRDSEGHRIYFELEHLTDTGHQIYFMLPVPFDRELVSEPPPSLLPIPTTPLPRNIQPYGNIAQAANQNI